MSVITQEGYSALMLAAMRGKTEVVVELVKAGAIVDMQNEVCDTRCTYTYSPGSHRMKASNITIHT